MKKRIIISVIAVVLLLVVLCVFWPRPRAKNEFVHSTFHGVVLSYEETDDGLLMVIDNDATPADRTFLITDSTMYPVETTKEQILNRETGFRVTVESEYWTLDTKDIYPATMITP